jgi:hypothetical protein
MSRHDKLCWAFWYRPGGEHVHMRVVVGPVGGDRAKCGDLVMRTEEFRRFRAALSLASTAFDDFEFIDEEGRITDASERLR